MLTRQLQESGNVGSESHSQTLSSISLVNAALHSSFLGGGRIGQVSKFSQVNSLYYIYKVQSQSRYLTIQRSADISEGVQASTCLRHDCSASRCSPVTSIETGISMPSGKQGEKDRPMLCIVLRKGRLQGILLDVLLHLSLELVLLRFIGEPTNGSAKLVTRSGERFSARIPRQCAETSCSYRKCGQSLDCSSRPRSTLLPKIYSAKNYYNY